MALSDRQARRPSATLVLIACCLLSIVSMTVWVNEGNNGYLHKARDMASLVTAPLQEAGNALTSPLRAVSRWFGSNDLTAEEIQAIVDENVRLRSDNIRLQEVEQEAKRLRFLVDIQDAYGLDMVGARVIGRSADSWNQTITINKGTNAGVRVGMPVMSINGLIGQIESAGPTSSEIRLITDQRSGVAVFLQATRAEGILEGSADGTLYLRYIAMDYEVVLGATVVTSGAGGVYPKGIPIGTVQKVDYLSSDIYQTIVIQPLGQPTSYEEVLVITGSESEVGTGSAGNTKQLDSQPENLPESSLQ
ncbi:MAG: rod shape-determining protein MreC [Coriobacteriales bacterium]|jgi:rod shape-determining protein MreC|nr:rod shape-determining protein MreC [Coriobacteriales bacterium]